MKLVPYMTSIKTLNLCVQIQGEMRPLCYETSSFQVSSCSVADDSRNCSVDAANDRFFDSGVVGAETDMSSQSMLCLRHPNVEYCGDWNWDDTCSTCRRRWDGWAPGTDYWRCQRCAAPRTHWGAIVPTPSSAESTPSCFCVPFNMLFRRGPSLQELDAMEPNAAQRALKEWQPGLFTDLFYQFFPVDEVNVHVWQTGLETLARQRWQAEQRENVIQLQLVGNRIAANLNTNLSGNLRPWDTVVMFTYSVDAMLTHVQGERRWRLTATAPMTLTRHTQRSEVHRMFAAMERIVMSQRNIVRKL